MKVLGIIFVSFCLSACVTVENNPKNEPIATQESRIRLEQARKLIEQGQTQAARTILLRLVKEGDPNTAKQAQELLDAISK